EGHLDRGLLRVELLLQRRHEQGPAVLEVRDRDHAEDAEEQDQPAVLPHDVRPPGEPTWSERREGLPRRYAGGRSSVSCVRNGITPGINHLVHISSILLWK